MDETIQRLEELRDFTFMQAGILAGVGLVGGTLYGIYYLLFKRKK